MNLECIDKPIRDVILELNNLGYVTNGCCAGYKYKGHSITKGAPYNRGYVSFWCSSEKAWQLLDALDGSDWEIHLGHYERYFLVYASRKKKEIKKGWEFLRELLADSRSFQRTWQNLREHIQHRQTICEERFGTMGGE